MPAGDTDEGDLCIEMRIRLYPDGLMSNLLLQLTKVRNESAWLDVSWVWCVEEIL